MRLLDYAAQFRRLARDTFEKRRPRAVILIYHRVANLSSDPQQLAVSPNRFDDHIYFLTRNYNVLSLSELGARLASGAVPPKSVVITFDDGYADNFYQAKPILDKHGVPATFFVTAGMIGSNREYWWDEIERICLLHPRLGTELSLTIRGEARRWRINTEADALALYNDLHPLLKYLKTEEREQQLANLLNWAGLAPEGRRSHLAMNVDEVRRMVKGGLIEIGAHTMTHCVLSEESEERQDWEIRESKIELEKMVGREVGSFSYPFGSLADFTPQTVALVRQAGFHCALANVQGEVEQPAQLFALPRRLVRDWDVNRLQQEMAGWFRYNLPDFSQAMRRKYLKNAIIRSHADELNKKITAIYSKWEKKQQMQGILQVNTHDNIGGAAKVAFRLHQRYRADGLRSYMMVSISNSDDPGVNVITQNISDVQSILFSHQNQADLQDHFHLSSFSMKDHPDFKSSDIIHFHNLHGRYFSPFALPEITSIKPAVWTLHDMHAITGHCAHSFECDRWRDGCGECPHLDVYQAIAKDTSALLWETKRRIYANSDMTIVCPSAWLKKKVEQSILKDKDIRLIPNGIDGSIFEPQPKESVRNSLGLPIDKTILLFSANGGIANYWKGGGYIDSAYERLGDTADFLFINLGGTDDCGVRAKNWLNVPYVGDEREMARYYAAADLLIYPSIADNLPLAILEAMACGLPVVAFRTGGIPEIITHMKTGYLASYCDNDDFVKGIRTLSDAPLRAAMADEAVREIKRRFTIDKMVAAYLKLYEEMVT